MVGESRPGGKSFFVGDAGAGRSAHAEMRCDHFGRQSKDRTVICTRRTDCTPARLVALERQGRKAWPTMVSRFEARIQRYGGIARHDSTGLGDVVAGYLTTPAWGVRLVGRTRSDLFSNCISGIERGSLGAPRITFMYKEHLYRRIGDLLVRATLPIPSWREVWPPLSAGCISA